MTKQVTKQIKRTRRPRPVVALGQRLGWRVDEWVALTGTSRPTFWRHVKNGTLKITHLDKIPIVPRTEAVRLGLVEA